MLLPLNLTFIWSTPAFPETPNVIDPFPDAPRAVGFKDP